MAQVTAHSHRRDSSASNSFESQSQDERAELEMTDDEESNGKFEFTDELGELIETIDPVNSSQPEADDKLTSGAHRAQYVETSLDYIVSDAFECQDNKGSERSADEEDEQRLIAQFQQQQAAEQRNRQHLEARQDQCVWHPNVRVHVEDKPPEVPIRRSSRIAGRAELVNQRPEPEPHPQPLPPRAEIPQRVPQVSSFRQLGQRPRQPPPPPPPPRPKVTRVGVESEKPATPTRLRSHLAPKNIWSPSSSSPDVASSSYESSSSNLMSSCQLAPPGSQSTCGSDGFDRVNQIDADELNQSSPSPHSTIVEMRGERHLESKRESSNNNIRGQADGSPESLTGAPKQTDAQVTAAINEQQYQQQQQQQQREHPTDDNQEQWQQKLAEDDTNQSSGNKTDRKDTKLESKVNEWEPPKGANWRSFSVSLDASKRIFHNNSFGPKDQATACASEGSKIEANSMDRRQANNRRSYSISTSQLPAGQHMGRSSLATGRAQGAHPAQEGESAKSKYWTLPSGLAQMQQDSSLPNESCQLELELREQTSGVTSAVPESNDDESRKAAIASPHVVGYSKVTKREFREQHKRKSADFCGPSEKTKLHLESDIRNPKKVTPEYHEIGANFNSSRNAAIDLDENQQQERSLREEGRENERFDEQMTMQRLYGDSSATNSLGRSQHNESLQVNSMARHEDSTAGHKDEWFKQMYRHMHRPTPEKNLLRAVNSQPDNSLIRITLKSPKTDHRSSPSYFSEEELKLRVEKKSMSPTRFAPGSICDYLPGQSSISQQERNLNLYYKLIDHIDRVFSSVLPEVNSRSTNTLHSHHKRPSRRRHSARRQTHQHSASGPQTPVHKRRHCEPLRDPDDHLDEHERRCVFTRLMRDSNEGLAEDEPTDAQMDYESQVQQDDPHKQYVAVQRGHDIPLKGLRKPAPQPNVYKVGPAPPTFIIDEDTSNGKSARELYEEHNQRLSQSLHRHRHSSSHQMRPEPPIRSSSANRNLSSPEDDIYRDFDSLYATMCSQRPYVNSSAGRSDNWSRCAAFETEALSRSLADVEAALQRATSVTSATPSGQVSRIGTHLESPVESTYGRLTTNPHVQMQIYASPANTAALRLGAISPIAPSIAASEQTRADSCNTNQSFHTGPALVEEMTLSDLEDEICSSLMAAKETTRSLGHGINHARNREPLPAAISRYSNTRSQLLPRQNR